LVTECDRERGFKRRQPWLKLSVDSGDRGMQAAAEVAEHPERDSASVAGDHVEECPLTAAARRGMLII